MTTTTKQDEKNEQLETVNCQFIENYRGYIREKPVVSLGLAVGFGFILSCLSRSYHHCKKRF